MWNRRFIETSRGPFEVFVSGEGAPLCVTHLYSEFNDSGDRFANMFVPYRKTFLINLKNAGQSVKALDDTDLDMEETVEDLEAVRKSLGFTKWDFAGHSTGGMLGLMYAVQYPEVLTSLVVVGAAASRDYTAKSDCIYHTDHPLYSRMQELRSLQLQPGLQPIQKRAFSAEVTKLSLFRPENYEQYFSGTIHKSVVAARLEHFSRFDFPRFDLKRSLPNVRVRTLVMCGKHDVQCPLRCSVDIYNSMPNSELIVFDESNHYPFLEESTAFDKHLTAFLNS